MTQTGKWIGKGWELTISGNNFWMLVLLTLLYTLATSAASGTGVGIILYGPLTAAYYAVIIGVFKTGKVDFERIHEGFNQFVPAMLIGLIYVVFMTIGLALCLVPALVVGTFYLFPFVLMLERRLDFWEAMEASRLKVQEDFWGFLGFFVIILLVNLLGTLLCGVGTLITMPITSIAIVAAYRDLWPEETVIREETSESEG